MDAETKANGVTERTGLVDGSGLPIGAVAGIAALATSGFVRAQENPEKVDDLNVAMVGFGAQGQVLFESCVNKVEYETPGGVRRTRPSITGLRFKAVCDIWSEKQKLGKGRMRVAGYKDVNVYEDYRELLAKETDLDAVIVATPDWMHAEHANAFLDAGKHVYCEKEMSNSLDKAKSMVETARRTGKLLQIGHQRRSNPRYIHAVKNLMLGERLLGRVTHAYGQWNRAVQQDIDMDFPMDKRVPMDRLAAFGYENWRQFRNWRWYKKYGGGPIVDLGSHQIDIFSWVFRSNPKSVTAAGGIDYYQDHEWYDNVLAMYEYENDEGTGRAFYQTLTTTSHGQFTENFRGEDGAIEISEVPPNGNTAVREAHAPVAKWSELGRRGWLKTTARTISRTVTKNTQLDVNMTVEGDKWPLPIELNLPAHTPHLQNFFDAIRLGKPLNCPPEIGYETAVAVLKVNEAVAAGRTLHFEKEEFEV